MRNLLVSLKNNLMKEAIKDNKIRLFFWMTGNTKTDLFDNSGKVLCTYKPPIDRYYEFNCDENVFSYLRTDQMYDDNIGIFAFTDNLAAGEYYILADPKGVDFPSHKDFYLNSTFLGRVTDESYYYYPVNGDCKKLQLHSYIYHYDDPNDKNYGLTQTQLFSNEVVYRCLPMAPELNRNGRVYAGKVTLY